MKTFNQFVNEATELKWKGGKPKDGSRIENDKFWDIPDKKLKYILKMSKRKALLRFHDTPKNEMDWVDDIKDVTTVLSWRKKNKVKVPG